MWSAELFVSYLDGRQSPLDRLRGWATERRRRASSSSSSSSGPSTADHDRPRRLSLGVR